MSNKQIRKSAPFHVFGIAVSLTLTIFTLVVVAINVNLREEIRNQIINRDAETIFLFTMMDRSAENMEKLPEVVAPWIQKNNSLTPSLWSSDLKGIIALQIFDADGKLKSKIPANLIPAALKKEDFSKLQQLTLVSKFHQEIWLYSLFDDPRFVLMDSPVPLLEVIIPVYGKKPKELEAIMQYWIEGNSMSVELSRLDRQIILQTIIALGIGYLIILTVFMLAYRQLRAANNSLFDEIEQRKLIEKELKRFRLVLDQAGDAIFMVGPKTGKIYDVNESACRQLGYKRNELLDLTSMDIDLNIPDIEAFRSLVQRVKDYSGSFLLVEGNQKCKDGRSFPAEVSVSVKTIENQEVLLAVVRDISEQKRFTRELLKSKEQLASAQQIARMGSWEWDINKNSVQCSDETIRILELSLHQDPVTRENFISCIHPNDIDNVNEAVEIALTNNSRFDIEHRLKHRKGPTRYVRQQAQVFRDDRDGAIKMLGTIQDITTEKLAEEETQKLRDMLSNVVDSMPTILIGVDNKGYVTQWNEEAEQSTGILKTAALDRLLPELLPQMEIPFQKLKEVIINQNAFKESKVPIKLHDTTSLYEITMYPLISRQQNMGGVILLENITERARLEEMMVHSQKMNTVGGLAAGMAHEINNPLASIVQNLQVLRNRLSSGMQKNEMIARECGISINAVEGYMKKRGLSRTIENILSDGKRAAKIISNMLNFAAKSNRTLSMVNVAELLDKSIELASSEYDLKKKYDFRSIKIVREYSPLVPHILCDESKIQQVFLNILKNGAHAMVMNDHSKEQPGFNLRINFGDDQKVCIEFEDNGPGMEEATRKKAFEPFFTTKEVGEGTGLGLSVSYYIIDEVGGTISIESEPGKGTKFVIQLPYRAAEIAQPAS